MKKVNEGFVCLGCQQRVPIASKTCRNHCPWCFLSLHVDEDVPGDRASTCQGFMIPTMYHQKNGSIKILFICQSCQTQHWNKIAVDDDIGALDRAIQKRKETYALDA